MDLTLELIIDIKIIETICINPCIEIEIREKNLVVGLNYYRLSNRLDRVFESGLGNYVRNFRNQTSRKHRGNPACEATQLRV